MLRLGLAPAALAADGPATAAVTLRTRIQTDEGVFLVYNALIPPDNPRDEAGYLAYWNDFAAQSVYYYNGLVLSAPDLGQALMALQRDMAIDLEPIAAASPRLERLMAEASVTPDASLTMEAASPAGPAAWWQPLTYAGAMAAMGFDIGTVATEEGGPDPAPLPCDPPPAASVKPEQREVRPERGLARVEAVAAPVAVTLGDLVAEALAQIPCDPGDGGGSPPCTRCCNCQHGCCGSACCAPPPPCGDAVCGCNRCCQGSSCCGSTDNCCGGASDPCCGSSDPCCHPDNPCCGDPCCGDLCCTDPCSCNTDPCDPICGDPCQCMDCDDGEFCNGAETCSGGACFPGTPPSCDDGDPCTSDSCVNGACTHAPVCPGLCCNGDCCEPAGATASDPCCPLELPIICCNDQCCTGECRPDLGCCEGIWNWADNGEWICCGLCLDLCGTVCCETGACCDGVCCEDGDPCTIDECVCADSLCLTRTCDHRPACDDGNPCTSDACTGAACDTPICAHSCLDCSLCPGGVCHAATVESCICEQSSCTLSLPSGPLAGCPGGTLLIPLTAGCQPTDCPGITMDFNLDAPAQPYGMTVLLPTPAVCDVGPAIQLVSVFIEPDATPGPRTIRIKGTPPGGGPTCYAQTTVTVVQLELAEVPAAFLPQNSNALTLVARIVPPVASDIIRFELFEVSDFPGDAMNHGNQSDTDPDLKFEPWRNPGFAIASNQLTATTNAAVGSATVAVSALDYGARGKIKATLDALGCESPVRGVPVDSDDDWLPDAYENLYPNLAAGNTDTDGDGISDGQEDDDPDRTVVANSGPNSHPGARTDQGLVGDGLVAFEEYRGFFMRGTHMRTSTELKDVFAGVDDDPNVFGVGLGFFTNLSGFQVHEITVWNVTAPEWQSINTRFINWQRSGILGATDQRALRVIRNDNLRDLGLTNQIPGQLFNQSPNEIDFIEINLSLHVVHPRFPGNAARILRKKYSSSRYP